ncbi:hypothetical protein UFOVP265_9 [uncultured Caudovirales phage]|jgi:hypothetical protein|uniref:Putative tail fiber protein gp53-like C-terminal domain-containing protein n=1 Tax=uncultured Caudovirales phage TaxID=2100421 RepID=A0A6J5LK42_9CAUD|nr:hypothetical protein UFOVP265_9 [uncultured Caudovirales phage]
MTNTITFSQFASANLSSNTSTLVGTTAPSGGTNFQVSFPLTWNTEGRPSSPATGILGYNTDLSQYEFWNGAAWVQLAAGGSGTVNTGATNEVAYYAANGTAISGLTTANSGVLVTTNTGSPYIATSNVVTNALLSQMDANTIKGNNTNSTANAADLTVSEVLTLLGASSFLESPGYAILPGGLYLQWGLSSHLSQNANQTITLPIAFPNNIFIVLTSPQVSGGTASGQSSCGIILSTSQINVSNSGTGSTFNIYWLAIGN